MTVNTLPHTPYFSFMFLMLDDPEVWAELVPLPASTYPLSGQVCSTQGSAPTPEGRNFGARLALLCSLSFTVSPKSTSTITGWPLADLSGGGHCNIVLGLAGGRKHQPSPIRVRAGFRFRTVSSKVWPNHAS